MAKLLELALTVLCVFSVAGFGNCLTSSRRTTSIRKVRIDEDTVVFPDAYHAIVNGRHHDHSTRESMGRNNVTSRFAPSMQMPLDLARKLGESNDIEGFFEENVDNFGQLYADLLAIGAVTIAGRFGSDDLKPVIPKGAACIPEMTVVPLVYPGIHDPLAFHMPTCTRVPRCGGCCNNYLLSCQPSQTKNVTYQILQLKQKPKGSQYKGYLNVTVEEHVKCKCNCVVKKEDCASHQRYVEPECRCVCPNRDLEAQCHNSGRWWDSDACVCRCANEKNCTTGTYFDEKSCSCRR